MTHIKPRGFSRNLPTDAALFADGKPLMTVVKPAYRPLFYKALPPGHYRRNGWMAWTPTPPPVGSHVFLSYSTTA